MNSEFSDPLDASLLQLERELQSLTPLAPSRQLVQTLNACMAPVAKNVPATKVHSFPWRRMVTPAAAAAAAVAVMSVQNHRRGLAVKGNAIAEDDATPTIHWEPMPMRNEYRTLLNAGVALNDLFEPEQHYFLNSADLHEWRSAADNSSVRLTIPRQQRFVMPASYEIEGLRQGGRRISFH